MLKPKYSFLALGDSYTVGESLPEEDNFPSQTVRLLGAAGYNFEPPEIIARTGWTTSDLKQAISSRRLDKQYSVVSLLIGVNNQYRGGEPGEYAIHFEELLQTAIGYAGQKNAHVFVLSIPDWGVTPFAEGRDRKLISKEIDTFNMINRSVSEKWRVNYIDITKSTRETVSNHSLVASDGLHPSAKEYKRWAEKLAEAIQQRRK